MEVVLYVWQRIPSPAAAPEPEREVLRDLIAF
jgi:hypothetical protein